MMDYHTFRFKYAAKQGSVRGGISRSHVVRYDIVSDRNDEVYGVAIIDSNKECLHLNGDDALRFLDWFHDL